LSSQYPTQAEPFAHIGLLEARQEHYSEAVVAYKKAIAADSNMPGLRLNLGLALFKDGDYKSAIQILEPLLKAAPPSSPESQRLTILIGMSHYGLKEFPSAIPYLKRASDVDTQNLTLLLTLAHSCLLSKQFPCVLDAYHRIVALNAESAEADMLVGEALDAMKDTIGATLEFRAAIVANPKEPNVHFGLGYLLWTQGQYQEAAQEFQAEIDNDPRHIQAMLYLADSQIQLNHTDDARPTLEKVVKLDPVNPKGHLDLGIVYADQNRKAEAQAELQEAVKLAPDDVNTHWRLGRLYKSMGDSEAAKAEFNKASKLNKAVDDRLLKIMSRIPSKDQSKSAVAEPQAQK
jgi:tetratricopeptide (TPR) repeat protein